MKTRSFQRRNGFTLIELLVVIAIIAVLAASSFGVATMVQNKAKKLVATETAQSIVTAVNSYYSENGSMPVPTGSNTSDGGTKFDSNTPEGLKVLNILLGKEEEINTRRVKYLTVADAKAKKGGVTYNSAGTEATGLYDPWGNSFMIILDTNYEERIKVKPGTSETTLNGRRCAVYTVGQDKKGGTADDVRTW